MEDLSIPPRPAPRFDFRKRQFRTADGPVPYSKTSTSPRSDLIMIIGGNLSGLVLANALVHHKVSVRIFLSYDDVETLSPWFKIRASSGWFSHLFDEDLLGELDQKSYVYDYKIYQFPAYGDEHKTLLPSFEIPMNLEGEFPTFATSYTLHQWVFYEETLRDVLIRNLRKKSSVQFNSKLVRYEHAENNVLAHFHDGSIARGRLLIGADGTSSQVRRQLASEFKVLDTEIRALSGRKRLNHTLLKLPDPAKYNSYQVTSIDGISDDDGITNRTTLFCHVDNRKSAGHQDQSRRGTKHLYELLLCARMESSQIDGTMKSRLQITNSIRWWHPKWTTLIGLAEPESMVFREFVTVYPGFVHWMPDPFVTIIGNVVHPTIPTEPIVNVNDYFEDAYLLLRAILDGATPADIIKYENVMRHNARQYLTSNTRKAREVLGMKSIEKLKPFDH